jgi:hypothetical protein
MDMGQDADPCLAIRLRRDQVFQDLITAMQVRVDQTKPLNLLQRPLQVWVGTRSGPSDLVTNATQHITIRGCVQHLHPADMDRKNLRRSGPMRNEAGGIR